MTRLITPPTPFAHLPRPWIFLAGTIEMDRAERWQDAVGAPLAAAGATVLNPRRDAWDASWPQTADAPMFREQVEWELHGQEQADLIVMAFIPGTQSPITLLELGLFAQTGRLVVCCPDGFWRKGNVDIVCQRYGVPQVADRDALVQVALGRLGLKTTAG